jgi:type III pantothenate kinase
MSLLLIDIGNTRCKWACVENGSWLAQGVVDNSAIINLRADFAGLPLPARILVANVAGAALAKWVVELTSMWSVAPEFVVASAAEAGVTNLYDVPSQLGCDRWLALIAARQQVAGACLVVNSGTATTIDALSAQGEFIGGLILPGIDLMQKSLSHNAAQLPLATGAVRDFPRNTADAISSGAILATVATIEKQRRLLGENASCLLSGGAATLLQPHLASQTTLVDNLVLRGLQILGEMKSC